MSFNAWILATILFVTSLPATAGQSRAVRRPDTDHRLKADILRIQNDVLNAYGTTDFRWVWDAHVIQGDRDTAGNFVVIPLVRGAAYTLKYELESRNADHLSAALDEFEIAERLYPHWGHGWISPAVVSFMTVSIYRLKENAGHDPLFATRIEADWRTALEILREEADGVLGQALPFAPLDSSTSGDTKAEENAWSAALLSTAAVFLPEDPHVREWETSAKALAYAAITRPSDPPHTPESVKTATVSDDFSLNNHGHEQNAYYTAATLELLQQGALPYRIAGRDVPEEFSHNAEELFRKYQTYVADQNGWPKWNVVCDEGDPTDLPLVMGDRSEYRYAMLKAQRGTLWRTAVPSPTIAPDQVWTAIQNHKVGWRYFVNVFLWHWPNPSGPE